MKRELFIVKCENLRKKHVTKIFEKKKLMKLSHILGHFEWTIINFSSKLNLQVEGLDPSYKT
jgi:hypothetical protein